MKKIHVIFAVFILLAFNMKAGGNDNVINITLNDAIRMAQSQSVDATVALSELKTAYWEYRTHIADQLPEINFTGTLPNYNNSYNKYQQEGGAYTYTHNNSIGMDGKVSVDQNVALTGGRISLNTSLDFTRQLGEGANNKYMTIPIGLTFTQPVFGVNKQKWNRRIEPLRYKEAKAAYVESLEEVTITTIVYYFNLLLAEEKLSTSIQNLENANKLYDIAVAKREIGHISESELMQLNLSALQAKGKLTEAQSNLNARMFQLRAFLGLSEQDVIELMTPASVPSLEMFYADVLEKAQQNNSFAKSILRRQLQADFEVATAKGNQRSIELFASVGYTGSDPLLGRAYDHLSNNQIVQIGLKVPLLDWGKRKGKVKVAESNRDVVVSKARKEQMDFNQNVFLLVENFNNQARQLDIAQQSDLIAEKRYKTSVETFLIGKINILDLNDAQKSKDEAKQKHIEELYWYWRYYYNIRSVTLYDFSNNRDLDVEFEEIIRH